jgi:hypothetical protein
MNDENSRAKFLNVRGHSSPSSAAISKPLIPCPMARGCFGVGRSKLHALLHWSLACGNDITEPRYQILSNQLSCFQAHSLVGQYETRL